MKKIILFLFAFFILSLNCFSNNMPLYMNSINVAGIGLLKMPKEFKVYEKQNLKSKVLTTFKWGGTEGKHYINNLSNNFIVLNEDKNIAFMAVTANSDELGWFEICYDQKQALKGWVYIENYNFYSWQDFYTSYGKANGLYAFKDLPIKDMVLYSKPNTNSQIVSKFKYPKNIQVQTFRDNWVLVRVHDYEYNMRIGWYKWRNDDGKFKLFPVIK